MGEKWCRAEGLLEDVLGRVGFRRPGQRLRLTMEKGCGWTDDGAVEENEAVIEVS